MLREKLELFLDLCHTFLFMEVWRQGTSYSQLPEKERLRDVSIPFEADEPGHTLPPLLDSKTVLVQIRGKATGRASHILNPQDVLVVISEQTFTLADALALYTRAQRRGKM